MKDKFEKYGKSDKGNFRIIDSIGVPHPYCITPKHVKVASDEFGGMLGKEAIIEAESKGACCDICRKLVKSGKQDRILSFDEHKQGLVIECKIELAVKDKIEGFVFVKV